MEPEHFQNRYIQTHGFVQAPTAQGTASFVTREMEPAMTNAGNIARARQFTRNVHEQGRLLNNEMVSRGHIDSKAMEKHSENIRYLTQQWPEGQWVPRRYQVGDYANFTTVSNMVAFTRCWLSKGREVMARVCDKTGALDSSGVLSDAWAPPNGFLYVQAQSSNSITARSVREATRDLKEGIKRVEDEEKDA
ncbi:uncharacterized protein CTRU02_215794 [Colletotrichum truncatum]|uniref:Uncharacterized protein n=1 Tax=Colletotrichum truncatum TaxID=5467 RepID=A0ACC3YBP3_COLTU